MKKNCTKCQQAFEIRQKDVNFYDKISPIFSDKKKYTVPAPNICPDCRHQKRLCFRNERNLYSRTCDLCKKNIISIYSPDKKLIVYCHDCWWNDRWDSTEYGKEYNFQKPFFEQYHELLKNVPKAAVITFRNENCEYTNFQNDSKDCYLTFGSGFMKDCMHCNWCYYAKDILDCSYCSNAELDYMNIDCFQTYHTKFCQDCKSISNCDYCFDCRNCQDCFGCVGLRNKQYHIFNQLFDKKTYEKQVEKWTGLIRSQRGLTIEKHLQKLKLAHPHLSNKIMSSENCTGDEIENCKNCEQCFGIKDCEDCSYHFDVFKSKDCYDVNRSGLNELAYEICGGGYYKNTMSLFTSANINDSYYLFECMYSQHLFGCVGVKRKEYMILNKSYSKEAYKALVGKIIEHMQQTGEWGMYFPASLSPFGYNETLAPDYYPLNEKEARSQGFQWSKYQASSPEVKKHIPAISLPDNINKVSDDILNTAIECEISKKPFKIIKQELNFYRKNNIPLPKLHPNERYKNRIKKQNPRRLWSRTCNQCKKPIHSPYSPDRHEIIYCENCYLKTIY
ncbi:hypothetical protein HYV57_01810 [Candidatus Peregrinibacteria bacterium]|nr:hypothetical protein [Candidatus Peregrinibacteria bacterium]